MVTVTLEIDELCVGMYVQDIILYNNQHKVKNRGTVNSKRTIAMLKKQGVVQVVVQMTPEEAEQLVQCRKDSAKYDISFDDEFARSCQIYDDATENVKQLLLDTSTNKPLSPQAMSAIAGEITESVMRNEHAITVLTRIRQRSQYQWEHAINCGILVCGFALFLGLKKSTVQEVTLGALLHDIGSAKVPKAILDKPGPLSLSEMNVVKKHVFWGIELAKNEGFASPIIVDMIVNHHERLDGSGYPRGIHKNKITKLSRITAIIDVYDAMTGDKPHKKGELPLTVLRHLLTQKDKFDINLVQQFIKYLGVHPVGSLVELSNEKLAVVIQGNRVEPLKPKIKVVYSLKLNKFITPIDHDLTEEEFSIIACVHPDDFQINLNKVIRDLVA